MGKKKILSLRSDRSFGRTANYILQGLEYSKNVMFLRLQGMVDFISIHNKRRIGFFFSESKGF
ncbi:hypothetical protein LEP1GSC161_0317 [Leptospira santarosai str. CBC1416]|uniref:Uncharacterized protein n=1 Tax=Leptospira santarosai str. CBC1416 TaxID=1193059 RepID=M6VUM3_9LEPT|nr:hypothetical protein LEP1GSC161_0317 [Leptospira santarosai str. CBC1416]